MIQKCVTPVKSVGLIIHGETIGPAKGGIPEHLDIGAIHVSSGDVGGSIPLAEEHVASIWMNYNCSGPLEVLEQCPSVIVILGREDIEGPFPRVDVVEVVAGPVHGQALHTLVLTGEDILSRSSILFHLKTENEKCLLLLTFKIKFLTNLVNHIKNNVAVINHVFM